jgi:hypothetical protein
VRRRRGDGIGVVADVCPGEVRVALLRRVQSGTRRTRRPASAMVWLVGLFARTGTAPVPPPPLELLLRQAGKQHQEGDDHEGETRRRAHADNVACAGRGRIGEPPHCYCGGLRGTSACPYFEVPGSAAARMPCRGAAGRIAGVERRCGIVATPTKDGGTGRRSRPLSGGRR